jgi:hypothetical protein
MADMDSDLIDPRVAVYLRAIHEAVRMHPLPIHDVRHRAVRLLRYLASAEGRTDANCRTVDLTLMNDEVLWSRIEEIEPVDPALADVLRDMGSALHDTISAPSIASNFDATPEQLLSRLGMQRE